MKEKNTQLTFLPTSRDEMLARGWETVDIVLVTGDAYVDHPSFGVALIGRLLEAQGYRVAILAQPRHDTSEDFRQFGRPKLFFGITAGNLDSIVANYSGNARVRDEDSYSPGGNPYFGKEQSKRQRRRPDRATIKYANLARAAYKDVPLVLGGVEASLRRFVHFDYQQNKLRTSVLTDAKADLLVYGMGERAILEIADRLAAGRDLSAIPGTCERLTDQQFKSRTGPNHPQLLPSWEEIKHQKSNFMAAELIVDKHARSLSNKVLAQHQQALWVVQNRPAAALQSSELDALYALGFTRLPHPAAGDVPAYRMIRDSVTIVRGCSGNCSFCAITRHQGPIITSRSPKSILAEIKTMAASDTFSGAISDLGGPTANLYGTTCASPVDCKRHDCLFPKLCKHLQINEKKFLDLLRAASQVPGVKHVFISSGLRMELLLQTPALLARILTHHTPGALKIAPEHADADILRIMHKPGVEILRKFLAQCREIAARHKQKISFTPYLISAHPGCTEAHMKRLAEEMKNLKLAVRQFQDFTPTPGTLSTAMYVTGLDRDTGAPIPVAKGRNERRQQRLMLETRSRAPAGKIKKRAGSTKTQPPKKKTYKS